MGRGSSSRQPGIIMPAQTAKKAPRFYPVDQVPAKRQAIKPNPTKLRASIVPGTVLIVLSGRFRGKRVVFLKQLESGLLLVTGPYKLNGVPLRRLNQAYAIATSTKVQGVTADMAKDITDADFQKKKTKKKTDEGFFVNDEESDKQELPEEFKQKVKSMDAKLMPLVAKTDLLDGYLKTTFSLGKGQYPHQMKF